MEKNKINCGMGAPGAIATQLVSVNGSSTTEFVTSSFNNKLIEAIIKETKHGKILPAQTSLYDRYWTEASQYDYTNICPEIDITKEYGEDEFLLEIGGVPTMPRGDIQAIKAHAKEGKTMLTSIFIEALLEPHKENVLGIKGREDNITISYFDTEQHPRNTKRIMLRINAMRGVAPQTIIDKLKMFSIRDLDYQNRINYILNKIKIHKPDMVIIDGIRDLVRSINDETECNEMIQLLADVAKSENIAILCILHKNKNKQDESMRGHLGAELENKASSVWEVRRSGNIVTVDETHARNEPTEKWQFKIGEGGIPCPPNAEEIANVMSAENGGMLKLNYLNLEELKVFIREVAKEPISYSTIFTKALMEEYNIGKPNATELAKEIIEAKLLLPVGKKYIYYEFIDME